MLDLVNCLIMKLRKNILQRNRRKEGVGNWFIQKSVFGLRRERSVLSLRDIEGFNSEKFAVVAKCCPFVTSLDASSCYELAGDDWRVMGEASWMSSLKILNLTFCQITDYDLGRIFSGRKLALSSITLSYTGISDVGLTMVAMSCPDLEVLKLCGCQNLTDVGLSSIAKFCKNLRHVELEDCASLNDIGVQLISQECPLLDHLNLKGCYQVTDEIIHYICYYNKQLEYLNLGNTQVTGSAVNAMIPLLSNLKHLGFCGLSITNETIDIIIGNLPGVKKIDFSFCYLLGEDRVKSLIDIFQLEEVLTFGLNFGTKKM